MENGNQGIDDEPGPPADPVVGGATYIHWKYGREYVVEAIALGNSDPFVGVDVVAYRCVEAEPGDRAYARTRTDFTALVTRDDGTVVRRFRRKPDEHRDVTNADRRTWARAALEAYMARKGTLEAQDLAEEMGRLHVDLLHLRDEIAPGDWMTSGAIGAIMSSEYEDEARADA